MSGYLLDTNHAGAAMRDDPRLTVALASHAREALCIAIPSVGELWYMVFNSSRVEANGHKLENLLAALKVLPLDDAAARQFGLLRAQLRRAGRPVPPVDVPIAAIAMVNDLAVVTSDHHFEAVAGLRIENWLAP